MPLDSDTGALESGGSEHRADANGDEEGEPKDENKEVSHRHPSYRNARWLRMRLGAPRWAKKNCRLLEGWMETDEIGIETELGSMIKDPWKILVDCDKSGKGALKSKMKEHKQDRRAKEQK